MSLLDTIEQAIFSRRPRKVLYNPLNDWPMTVGGDTLEPGAEPQTTYPEKDNEIRAVGTVAAAGDNVVLPRQNNYDVHLLEFSGQTSAPVVLQLKAGSQAISTQWALSAGEKWSAPGIIVSRSFDLILNLSTPVQFNYEVRWRPAYGRL
jgi:hypothetical protein